jgi:hypothetical protein
VLVRLILIGEAHYRFNREDYLFGNSLNIFVIVGLCGSSLNLIE